MKEIDIYAIQHLTKSDFVLTMLFSHNSMRNPAYSLMVQTSTPFHILQVSIMNWKALFYQGFDYLTSTILQFFFNIYIYFYVLKYGHSCINYRYVCEIVDIYNFFYIHIYVLKYKHSRTNYEYVYEIVDIYQCLITIRKVSIIVYQIQWKFSD